MQSAMLRLRVVFASIALALAAAITGCASPSEVALEHKIALQKQKFSLDEVRERLDRLTPGMTKTQVQIILGSPGISRGDEWIYVPERSGAIVPVTSLKVVFENNIYQRHTTIVGLGG